MGLCESLYLPLNGLEIALRNRVQRTLSTKLGKGRWWDPQWKLLPNRDLDQVDKVMKRLAREGKHPNIGRVVSGLTLGFWVGLFAADHERLLWKGDALRRTFPYALRKDLGYHNLRRRLFRIRFLRNRVFHHEPIWQWADLDEAHMDVVEMTKWLSADMYESLRPYDRFADIYKTGYQPYLAELQKVT
ncbi:hypothetical protein IT575_03245 [bacterium]|nr:hypothetical protein [bacterium]